MIDRCNFNEQQRRVWTGLAQRLRVSRGDVWAVWLRVPVSTCIQRVMQRVGHRTLGPDPTTAVSVVTRFDADLEPPNGE